MKELLEILDKNNITVTDPRVLNLAHSKERLAKSVNQPGPWFIEQHLDTGLYFITHQEERESDEYKPFNDQYVIVSVYNFFQSAAEDYNKRVGELFAPSNPVKQTKSIFGRVGGLLKTLFVEKLNFDRI